MNRKHIAAVFRKDALELLRDRRTWFVNIVLPVLMYPVLAIIGIQVFQITQPGPEDLPSIAIHAAPKDFIQLLEFGEQETAADSEQTSSDAAAPNPETANKKPALLKIQQLSISQAATFRRYLDNKAAAHGDTADTNSNTSTDTAASDEQLAEHKQASLDTLKDIGCSAAILCTKNDDQLSNWRIELIADNAHRDYLSSSKTINNAVAVFRKQLLQERLRASGLSAAFTQPATLQTANLASTGDSIRTHFLAGFLPVLLVLMVIVGTFHPAPDLIAGERERGTLETLLSWPSDRQSIFVGKLLVVIVATIATVLLNLTSLTMTANIIGSQLPGGSNSKIVALSEIISVGPETIILSIVALFPITILIATLSLAVAGLAKSYKEAQNYLSPMVILFTMPSMVCLLPHIKPNLLLDLIPLIGPLVALKACLQGAELGILHLGIATVASIGMSAMVVSWACTLLNKEQFLFPNLKNMGWKQIKQWRQNGNEHGGLDAMLMFAAVLGCYLMSSTIFAPINTIFLVSAPLVIGIALPCLIFVRVGQYRHDKALFTNTPQPLNWLWTILLIPVCVGISLSLGNLQIPFMPENTAEMEMMTKIFEDLNAIGGLGLMLVCVALVPGVCEEIFCRGILLSGFNKSLGPRFAILMSAFLFAALHMSIYRFVPQFVLGIFLAVVVLRSRSIWLAMLIHFGHNGSIVLVEHFVKQDPELMRQMQEASTRTFTSADVYGFVAGFIIAASIAAGLCMLLKPSKIETGTEPNRA